MIEITKSKLSSTGYQIYLTFIITQHIRDELLMKSLISYLDCGRLTRKRNVYEFQVSKFSDIADKIIVFFFFLKNIQFLVRKLRIFLIFVF